MKALKLYKQACDGGEAVGCYNLGIAYESGPMLIQNHSKAIELFKKACKGGFTPACGNW